MNINIFSAKFEYRDSNDWTASDGWMMLYYGDNEIYREKVTYEHTADVWVTECLEKLFELLVKK